MSKSSPISPVAIVAILALIMIVAGVVLFGDRLPIIGSGSSRTFPTPVVTPIPPVESPIAEQPPEGQPPEGQPPEGQPPEGQPPEGQPPEGQPPEGQPPEGQPPEGQPPEGQPPVEQPPVEQPPVEQPTITPFPSIDGQPPIAGPPPEAAPGPPQPPAPGSDVAAASPSIVPNSTPLESNGWTYTVPGFPPGPVAGIGSHQGRFFIVVINVANATGQPQSIPADFFVLKDGQGRVYNALPEMSTAFRATGGVSDLSQQDVIPADSVTRSMPIIFDVAPDANNLVFFSRYNTGQGWQIR